MAAITLNLDDKAHALIDDWVRHGFYGSAEEVIEAGIAFVREQVARLDVELTSEVLAAIEAGRADIAAGRHYPAEEVFAELRERYRNWPR